MPTAIGPVLPVVTYDPERSVTTFATTSTQLTGNTNNTANMIAIWDPSIGRKFRLKGFHIYATVVVDIVSVNNHLALYDSEAGITGVPISDMIWSLSSWWSNPAVGTNLIGSCDPVYIPSGRLSRAINNNLYIGCAANLTSGTIFVNGVVWGTEE